MSNSIIVFTFFFSLLTMNIHAQVTKTYIQFDDIKLMCASIYQQAQKDNFQPDLLIGICRGGLVPLGILAGEPMFNNRTILTVDVTSYDENGEQKELKVLFPVHLDDYKDAQSVLIIDDLVDSGLTIDCIVRMIKQELPNATVKVATLFYKKRSKIIPDYFAQEATDWIVFPWEV